MENKYKIVVSIFGAAYAAPNKGTTILYLFRSLSTVLQKIVEFKDFSRLLSDFPVLFKADLIFKDFSRKPSEFKYFQACVNPGLWFTVSELPSFQAHLLSSLYTYYNSLYIICFVICCCFIEVSTKRVNPDQTSLSIMFACTLE